MAMGESPCRRVHDRNHNDNYEPDCAYCAEEPYGLLENGKVSVWREPLVWVTISRADIRSAA